MKTFLLQKQMICYGKRAKEGERERENMKEMEWDEESGRGKERW
jgi:hypothetical protein